MAYPYNYPMPAGYNPTPYIQPQPQPQTTGYSGMGGLSPASRPVTSREEAISVAADFSGALMVLPDIAHNRVYIKRWNYQTGASDFLEFMPMPDTQQERAGVETGKYVQQSDFDIKIQELMAEIEKLKANRGGKKAHDE